ncbi:transaldolase [Rickettsiella endosymbiont of Dermanyssus gallinae]|uniref:transaldolase n=1 Tax=Rickettsiella endosymbiont of Dermanyssus gallinae TaxID=2856608 RepID=UPI001C52F4BC|nr:transaldolase [Rickettsiella endosymbiont of Dermanyssus gallinae]
MSLDAFSIKLFADGADKEEMLRLYQNPLIKGFTTNPSLMKKAGVYDYRSFRLDILTAIPDRPISFEVFSDDLSEMYNQALTISTWGEQVYVKIPVSNTQGESTLNLISLLAKKKIKQNVTALTTLTQVKAVSDALGDETAAYISVFAGRIADTGIDPVPLMFNAVKLMKERPNQELIWASPREIFNVVQAAKVNCPIITLTGGLFKKIEWIGKDLNQVSLETVKMFREDAVEAGLAL